MADTGWVTAGTGSQTGTAIAWTNPGNITADDGNNATNTQQSQITNYLDATNFGFSLPTGALIDGIEVRYVDYSDSANAGFNPQELWLLDDTGTTVGLNKQLDFPNSTSTPTTHTIGATNDLWGASWTKAKVEDADFGARVRFVGGSSSSTLSIDAVQIRITYHTGLPSNIVGHANQRGRNPPHKATNGNWYFAVINNDPVTDYFSVYKATDPTLGWTEQDSTDRPTVASSTAVGYISSVIDGNTLHMVATDGTFVRYAQFNCATDQWVTTSTSELVESITPNFGGAHWVDIAVRSDGDVIVSYVGNSDAVMGNDKTRADYARRESGTWTAGQALDAAGDVHYGKPSVCRGPNNDEMHFHWARTTNTASDPAAIFDELQARTLDSANSLSTTQTGGTNSSGRTLVGGSSVSYTDGGTDRIIWCDVDFQSGNVYDQITVTSTEDASGDIQSLTERNNSLTAEAWKHDATNIYFPTCLAVDGTDLYWIYVGGGADGVDRDVYLSISTDDGVTWAEEEIVDGVTATYPSCAVYTRGTSTVLGFVYYDVASLAVKYDEYVIDAGATTASGTPSIPAIVASGTAKRIDKKASGTPSIAAIEAAGSALRTSVTITDVANSGETPGSGSETWNDGSSGNVITGSGFL